MKIALRKLPRFAAIAWQQKYMAKTGFTFLTRFHRAFSEAGMSVSMASDGYEALAMLEHGGYQILLADAGVTGIHSGLDGMSSVELSRMWRQIEGKSAHVVIGLVSSRISTSGIKQSRLLFDPALLAKNRGAEHHFWYDESDGSIISEINETAMDQDRTSAKIAELHRHKIAQTSNPIE